MSEKMTLQDAVNINVDVFLVQKKKPGYDREANLCLAALENYCE